MTSIIDDYKDIASRMKGELKALPVPKVEMLQSPCKVILVCHECGGSGQDQGMYWQSNCPYCNGSGMEP